MNRTLAGKTIFISGGSRGIGLAIAMRAARDGANVAIAAKTTEPHPSLPGTIHSAARQIEDAGGRALPLVCDIREEEQVEAAVAATVKRFGGIDICLNNASAVRSTSASSRMPGWMDASLFSRWHCRASPRCCLVSCRHGAHLKSIYRRA